MTAINNLTESSKEIEGNRTEAEIQVKELTKKDNLCEICGHPFKTKNSTRFSS